MDGTRDSSRHDALLYALDAVGPRQAGSDCERRAALLAAAELRSRRRRADLETFWCRPNWALAHAWHVALGILGSLLAVGNPRIGGVIVLAALVFTLADGFFGVSPGRRLSPERASQNVVSRTEPGSSSGRSRPPSPAFHLLLTANLDAGRTALAYRHGMRDRTTRLRRTWTNGRAPGWQAWIVVILLWILVVALLRLGDPHGAVVAVLQLVGTVALVLVLAILLELAGARAGPAASDNASGVVVALAAARALDAAPPTHASVEVVLTGAGDGQGIGLRRHLRAHRYELTPHNTIVVGLGPAGAGDPVYLTSDGPLAPLGFLRRLTDLGRDVAAADPSLGLRAECGRGVSPALPARAAGIPAITLCCLAADGTAPRSHRPEDRPAEVELGSIDRVLRAVLLLVDGLDDELASLPRPPEPSTRA